MKKIMMVDDDPDHLLLCELIFTRRGYGVAAVLGCEDLQQLAQKVAAFKPDLIFMDHAMPRICGMDATKFLKADPRYSHIPIIYFTGQDNIVELAKEAGADEIVRKPFNVQSLLEVTDRSFK